MIEFSLKDFITNLYICNMNFTDRLNTILTVYNLNASEFADKIDVQRSSISHILSGRNKPSLDFMIKVKSAFPELNWDWLILGEGPMYADEVLDDYKKEEVKSSPEKNSVKREPYTPTLFDDSTEIPEQPKNVSNNIKNKGNESIIENNSNLRKIVWFYGDGTMEVFEQKK